MSIQDTVALPSPGTAVSYSTVILAISQPTVIVADSFKRPERSLIRGLRDDQSPVGDDRYLACENDGWNTADF